ncbi:acyltransferase [Niabella hirudinis]|uniref:acyltransferase n=1 Tax=Niabella hirudinis TaxID=1285929 RepID=UPI003EBA1B71
MKTYKKVFQGLDFVFWGWLVNWAYPQYFRQRYGYMKYWRLFFGYVLPQKLFRINAAVSWPVHFTSKVACCENIQKGILCDPGDSPGVYIQAMNGIVFGNNIGISPGVKIISANHTRGKLRSSHDIAPPIKIGNNVMIYANSIILPGVEIGNNVIIGAGSVVTKSIPSDSIAVGNPCRVIRENIPYTEDFSEVVFNRRIPERFRAYLYSLKDTAV